MIRAVTCPHFPEHLSSLPDRSASARLEDLRIDQHILVSVLHIDNHDALADTHLRCGKADAVILIHCLKHIFDELKVLSFISFTGLHSFVRISSPMVLICLIAILSYFLSIFYRKLLSQIILDEHIPEKIRDVLPLPGAISDF